MKIGIDARFIGPKGTGLGVYTENLVENLQKIDKKNKYSIFLKKDNWDYIKLQSKNFQKILANVSWYTAQEQIKMPALYTSQSLDLVHIPHFNVPILYRGKFIVTIHDLIHHHFPQTTATTKNFALFKLKRLSYRLIFKNAVKKSKKIITPSNFVKEDLIKTFGINPSKIAVTHEAAEEEYFFAKRSTINDKRSTIIYVGNAYPHKNLNRLLDAIKILSIHHKPLTINLILVCPRDIFAGKLAQEIEKRNLKGNVQLLGWQKPEKLSRLFKNATAYISPSLSEGFGIPGLNAMTSNIPVICSDIPTFREIYGNAAIYFDPRNPKDIAQKIKKVLKEEKARSDLINKGIDQVKKYSWLKMAKQTLSIYESV